MCVKVATKCADAALMCAQKCKIVKSRILYPGRGVESQTRDFWGSGHKCSIANMRVFGPDRGVQSQKRAFNFIESPDIGVESQKCEFWVRT